MIATVAAGVLVFARLGGMLMVLPGIATGAVPAYARLAVAVPLTVLLLPGVGAVDVPATLSALLGAVAAEAMLGVAMGFAVALVFGALSTAMEVISAQSGLQIASMLDPLTLSQPGVVGVLATWLGTGVFFGGDLHLQCIAALGASLQSCPPGQASGFLTAGATLVPLAGAAVTTGVQLAGPLVVFVFCVNLGLSIVGRMAPGLQLFFAIGPTLTVIASLALLAVALPTLLSAWYHTLPAGWDAIASLLRPPG